MPPSFATLAAQPVPDQPVTAAPVPAGSALAGPTSAGAGPGLAPPDEAALNRVARTATSLGRDIVEIGGVLDRIDAEARAQTALLGQLQTQAAAMQAATLAMGSRSAAAGEAARKAQSVVEDSIALLSTGAARSRLVAEWVAGLSDRMVGVGERLHRLGSSNSQIAEIARHVRMLAINAKIEAARAGVYGLGFGVVAEEIGELANKTGAAAEAITGDLSSLKGQIGTIQAERAEIAEAAGAALTGADRTDGALGDMAGSVSICAAAAGEIAAQSDQQRAAVESFLPAFERIGSAARATAERISAARASTQALIDGSEALVQQSASLGGVSAETRFIARVQQAAAEITALFEAALDRGELTEAALFSQDYRAVPGSDPAQVIAPFTAFTDRHLPAIQEPALTLDRRVVFCAAVNRGGYLPTHNVKFSQPQGRDPVWNATHCRNRRIFDDRVGLKAGRSTAPFLLQVYRRDMGGGQYVIMNDVSAPVFVRGRHWGGVRMGYGF